MDFDRGVRMVWLSQLEEWRGTGSWTQKCVGLPDTEPVADMYEISGDPFAVRYQNAEQNASHAGNAMHVTSGHEHKTGCNCEDPQDL